MSSARDSRPLTIALGYQPPFGWDELLGFLAGRAIPGVEAVEDGKYLRTFNLLGTDGSYHQGWLIVANQPEADALLASVIFAQPGTQPGAQPDAQPGTQPGTHQSAHSGTDDGLVAEISTRLRHLFDLDCQPGRVSETLLSMNALDPQFFQPGVRLPGCFDAFEMTVRAVLGQQVTVKAARTLAKRLAAAFGSALAAPPATLGHTSTTGAGTPAQPAPTTADAAPETAPVEAPSEPPLLLAFPPPERIVALGDAAAVADQLGPLGVTSQRSRAILSLAQSFVDGSIDYRPGADAKLETEKLVALPGIGPWTAQYIAMRALACPDIFLHTDFGVKKALAGYSPAEALKLAEPWRPWRSYATISLWNWLGRPPAASARQQQKAGRTAPPSRLQVP